jgi:hypothetical protein
MSYKASKPFSLREKRVLNRNIHNRGLPPVYIFARLSTASNGLMTGKYRVDPKACYFIHYLQCSDLSLFEKK